MQIGQHTGHSKKILLNDVKLWYETSSISILWVYENWAFMHVINFEYIVKQRGKQVIGNLHVY